VVQGFSTGKKHYQVILVALVFSLFVAPVAADQQSDGVELHYFYLDGCPYCEDQEQFHEELRQDYNLDISKYDVTDESSIEKLEQLSTEYGVMIERVSTPMTFVGGEFFQGFNPQVGGEIENIIRQEKGLDTEESEETDYIPLIGELDLAALSLPVLAVVLGSVDGLNVCSIGALILILGIVMKFDSRKLILFYGGLFILTTVTVYGLLIFVWYNLFEAILTYLGFIRVLIGLAAIIGGLVFLRQFIDFYKHGPTCKTTANRYVTEMTDRVKKGLHESERGFITVATGVMLFAVAITLIELPCSVALPMVFSGVLVDANLSAMSYSFYIMLYLFFYMLIELTIFLIAVFTKDIWYGPDKAVTWATFVGAVVLIGLGLYYLLPLI